MKIENQGISITEIGCGIARIDVMRRGAEMYATVEFNTSLGEWRKSYDAAELDTLIEALTAARGHMTPPAAETREPRVIEKGADIPDDVTRVADVDGDHWARDQKIAGDLWSSVPEGILRSGSVLSQRYGPLTEVIEE